MSKSEIDRRLNILSSILSQSELNAGLIILPMKHTKITVTTLLANRRFIEDRMLKYGLDMSTEIVINYKISDQHASDCRSKHSLANFVVSEKMCGISPWSQRKIPCELFDVPLLKVKDRLSPQLMCAGLLNHQP